MSNKYDDDDISPEALSEMTKETAYSQGPEKLRVKIPKGKTWIIRILNAKIGPKRKWYVRLAWHWFNSRPILCSRHSSEDIGGNPDNRCLICECADELLRSPKPDVAKYGARIEYMPMWLLYCLVFEQGGQKSEGDDKWKVWEFNLKRPAWNVVSGMVNHAINKGYPTILSVKEGRDIIVKQPQRGGMEIRMDDYPSPLCKLDALDRVMAKIEKFTPKFDYAFPDKEKCRELVEKIKDAAYAYRSDDRTDADGDSDDRPRRAPRDDDRPAPRDDDRPSRRRDDDRPEPRDDRPVRPRDDDRPSRTPDEDDRSARPRDDDRPARPAREDDDRPSRSRDDDRPARRHVDDEPESNDNGDQETDEDDRPAKPAQAQPKLEPPPASRRTVDDDDDLPNERRDPAPPIRSEEPDPDGPPPPVKPPKSSGLTDTLRGRVAAIRDE